MKLNKKGKELHNIWWKNYCRENDILGGNSAAHNFVEGWSIIDNDDYVKTLTDECGLLIFGYGEDVFNVLDEWARDCGEDDNCCAGHTIAEVRKELSKYFED